jgi:hypothetical protein
MRVLLRLLGCFCIILAFSSCEDPQSVQPKEDKFAVSYTIDSAYSRTVTLRVHIPEKVKLFSVHWDFGDGTTARVSPDSVMVHSYKRAGDYIVRAASDPTDSALLSDTIWVRLKSSVTDFRVHYKVDPSDQQRVQFWLDYPAGFLADSVFWNFGDGSVQLIHTDSTHWHKYKRADDFKVILSYNLTDPRSVIDTVLVALTNDAKKFTLRYWVENSNSKLVHFNLSYPKGFPYDSLFCDFGNGQRRWLASDTATNYTYDSPGKYKVLVGSDTFQTSAKLDSIVVPLASSVTLQQLKKFNTFRVTLDLPVGAFSMSGTAEFVAHWIADSILLSSSPRMEGDETMRINYNADETLSIDEIYYFQDSHERVSQRYDIPNIYCEKVTESSIEFYIGRNLGLKQFRNYYWEIDFAHGADGRKGNDDFRRNFQNLKVEFYNR